MINAPRVQKIPKIQPLTDWPQFHKAWDRKIDHIIASMGMADLSEDIKQDIYLVMCSVNPETGKTGLESFDPTRGSFSTYVYALVLIKAKNARAKRQRELGLMPFSHDESKYEGDDSMSSWAKDKLEAHGAELSGAWSEQERAEFRIQLDGVMAALSVKPVRSHFFRDGECVTRDLRTLFDLILDGKSREEIVEYFNYSTGSVGVMFEQLRQVPELVELRDMVRDVVGG